MSVLKSVCVYCGASSKVRESYKEAAIELGRQFAHQGTKLVYGGGDVGIMGIVANSVMQNNGEVTGIIPHFLDKLEVGHTGLTELILTENMHERKNMMAEMSEAFVVLPGGLGTLEEFFEVATWKQLGLHDKPIVIFNVDGYWDHLIQLIDHQIEENFAKPANKDLFSVATNVEEVIQQLNNAPKSTTDIASKWT